MRAKTGLNRSMSRAGLSEMHSYIERPGRLRGVALCPVQAAGTSLTCHWCWAPGIRETQADFYCPECNLRCNADLNPSLNIRSSRRIGGRGYRREPVGHSPASPARTSTHRPVITGTTVYKPPLRL